MKNKIPKILQNDKALHFVYSFVLIAFIFAFCQLFLKESTALGLAAVVTILIGIAKELKDEKFDVIDLGFDLLGIVAFVLLQLAIIHL